MQFLCVFIVIASIDICRSRDMTAVRGGARKGEKGGVVEDG